MSKTVGAVLGWFAGMLVVSGGWGVVLDFNGLSGKVPDNYGGLTWVDPLLGNQWEVDPSHPPQNPTPCAIFDSGDMTVEATITTASAIDFMSIEFSGYDGDMVQLFGHGTEQEYTSGRIALDGSSVFRFEERWLKITSLTIYFDSLYPGSTSIDNLRFEPSHRLATIFREDFDAIATNVELQAAGWEIQHGQYPATDGGIWHIERETLHNQGVFIAYVISNSDDEGELPPSRYIDERLVSPEIDCREFTNVHLEFRQNLKVYPSNAFPEVFNVDISTDPGHTSWQPAKPPAPYWNEEKGSSFYPQSVDISGLADGKKIRIRWRYTTSFDYWWAIDEVRVAGRAALEVSEVQVNAGTGEMSIGWEAPNGFFAIEASDDAGFSSVEELATGITEREWTGSDPWVSEGQRFYRVRMD